MEVKEITQSTSSSRTILAQAVPLKTPFIVQVFPAYACNFRCNYCIHSIDPSKRGFISDTKYLDFDLYKKAIDDLKEFPEKIKMLRFAATGEPLLHPQIAEMIAYAKEQNIANSIEIVSNGALLNKKLSDDLINAGLDWLRISIQGINSKKYMEISNAKLDFNKFVENLTYFYKNKKNTKVYIKIIDCALGDGEDKIFYDLFENISDKIAIEHLVPVVSEIDYTKLTNKVMNTTQNGNPTSNVEVCPQPFYMMQLNPDGNIMPCCSMLTPITLGNIKDESMKEIWTGQKYKCFQMLQLNKLKSSNEVCAKCQSYKFGMFPEDVLDNNTNELKNRILK